MNYWLFITRPEFWIQLKPPNSNWIYRREYSNINVGDKAIVFVSKKKKFTAVLEITSGFTRRTKASAFSLTTNVEYLVALNEDHYIDVVDYLEDIDLFRGKSAKGWGATLQKSVISISKRDYDFITDLMLKVG